MKILRSPCPDIFKYEKMNYDADQNWIFSSENHRWRGVVQVAPTLPVFLKVKLLVPSLLPSVSHFLILFLFFFLSDNWRKFIETNNIFIWNILKLYCSCRSCIVFTLILTKEKKKFFLGKLFSSLLFN